jgi:hypothetical protein
LLKSSFNEVALAVFAWQKAHNQTYREYLRLIGKLDSEVNEWIDIPCVPISLFRTHNMQTGQWTPEVTFESSGTTGSQTSRHPIRSLHDYQQHCIASFEQQLGSLSDFKLLALLPNYLERSNSGLIAMVDAFLAQAAPGSDYYLHDFSALRQNIQHDDKPVLLWGVTFALLDLISDEPLVLPKGSIVLETGGMKGRGPELTREQLHERLREGFLLNDGSSLEIQSEYGMTEMQSQAYLGDDGYFIPATSLRIRARDVTDPFAILPPGRSGALNLYDLANVDTCAFLQSDDLGRCYEGERFEVLGRLDQSIVRGCNLLGGGN